MAESVFHVGNQICMFAAIVAWPLLIEQYTDCFHHINIGSLSISTDIVTAAVLAFEKNQS